MAEKKTTKKKTTAKKATTKKPAKKATAKKAEKKTTTKKAAAKKTTTKKAAAKKTTTKKAAAKKTTTKKAAAKKTTTKKAAAKKTTTKKVAAKKTTKKVAAKKTDAKKPAKKAASKSPAKKTTKKKKGVEVVEEVVETKPKKSSKNGKADKGKKDDRGGKQENGKATKTHLKDGEVWLNGLFDKMGLDVKSKGKLADLSLDYNLSGKSTEKLVAASRSLEAISTILKSSILDSRSPIRVGVDVNGLKDKRAEFLDSVAEELAEFAKGAKLAVTVAGLNSMERRAIHEKLSEDGRVSTESDGMGVFRKIRLEPKKKK